MLHKCGSKDFVFLPLILIRHCRMQGRRQDVGRYCYFLDFTAKMGGVGEKVLAQGHVDRKRQGWDPPQKLSTTAPAAPHYYHCLPPNYDDHRHLPGASHVPQTRLTYNKCHPFNPHHDPGRQADQCPHFRRGATGAQRRAETGRAPQRATDRTALRTRPAPSGTKAQA